MSSNNCQNNENGIAIVTEDSSSSLAGTGNEKPRKRIVKKRGEFVRITQVDSKKYAHGFGEKYPGLIVGHDSCKGSNGMVPKYMGWLWNVETLGINKVRKGWCPGAISKPIDEIMQQFLNPYPCQTQNNFCGNEKEPENPVESTSNDMTQNSTFNVDDDKSKELICEKCQGKECRDMDTQYDINDVVGIIMGNEMSNNSEIPDNTETDNQRENGDTITEKMSSGNNEAPNQTRKSAFQGTYNEIRKSLLQGTKNNNRKSGKGKDIIEKSIDQKQKRKSTANPNDLKGKTPRKSK